MAAVIGDPVGHSRSPAIHNAAFSALGLDWVYVALPVPAGSAAEAVEAARTLGIAGLSVTMPHKSAVIPALDDLTPAAARLGAVNCISVQDHHLTGHNTDGEGFVAALRADDLDPLGARCVVLGAGGAARAVVLALAEAGAAEVVVLARSLDRAEQAAELAGEQGRWGPMDSAAAEMATTDLLVNATPLGMSEGDRSPVPADALNPEMMVSELIYHPERTPLMEAAVEAGARTSNGLGMLVRQAAAAFTIWTGEKPPIETMWQAARSAPGATTTSTSPT